MLPDETRQEMKIKSKSDLEQSREEGQLVKWQMTAGMMDSEGNKWELKKADKIKREKWKVVSREESEEWIQEKNKQKADRERILLTKC